MFRRGRTREKIRNGFGTAQNFIPRTTMGDTRSKEKQTRSGSDYNFGRHGGLSLSSVSSAPCDL
ncbi:hypothetical protein DPMN_000962 [Dreissena polymorpha]|uniref:Uncharacterized protein n=1 Tax=Dreissena polymorpha TaxID=45954 RepID=A0A9D4MJ60_DREPO|nr:hypothetical protein DPMN_000962 [Dreissena polymorpha]